MQSKSWRLGFENIIFKRDLQAGQTAHPFFLGSNLLQDPFARRGLADLYQALKGVSPGDLSSPEKAQLVLRTIQQAASSGELVSVRVRGEAGKSDKVSGGGPPKSSKSSRSSRSSPPRPASNAPEKTWVDVQLVDPDGTPVPGAKYKLKITDGSIREGTLDDQGRVRVSGIDPGSCTVWFPDYDAKEWRPL
jgi:hypothetical protein